MAWYLSTSHHNYDQNQNWMRPENKSHISWKTPTKYYMFENYECKSILWISCVRVFVCVSMCWKWFYVEKFGRCFSMRLVPFISNVALVITAAHTIRLWNRIYSYKFQNWSKFAYIITVRKTHTFKLFYHWILV